MAEDLRSAREGVGLVEKLCRRVSAAGMNSLVGGGASRSKG